MNLTHESNLKRSGIDKIFSFGCAGLIGMVVLGGLAVAVISGEAAEDPFQPQAPIPAATRTMEGMGLVGPQFDPSVLSVGKDGKIECYNGDNLVISLSRELLEGKAEEYFTAGGDSRMAYEQAIQEAAAATGADNCQDYSFEPTFGEKIVDYTKKVGIVCGSTIGVGFIGFLVMVGHLLKRGANISAIGRAINSQKQEF